MSKISIKTDFADGNKLFAVDLNNNFRVIQAGINANDEQLEGIIEDAITRLDNELQTILDEHIWTWNSGEAVTFYKGTTSQINNIPVKNGQILYNTATGETALDTSNQRINTGSGNVVAVGNSQPSNPATKLWIDTAGILSTSGKQLDYYQYDETLTNKIWKGRPVYRKIIDFGYLPDATYTTSKTVAHGITNIREVVSITGTAAFTTIGDVFENEPDTTQVVILPNANMWVFEGHSTNGGMVGIQTTTNMSTYYAYLVLEYTKI